MLPHNPTLRKIFDPRNFCQKRLCNPPACGPLSGPRGIAPGISFQDKKILKPGDSQRKAVSTRKSYNSSGALRERLGAQTMADHTLARRLCLYVSCFLFKPYPPVGTPKIDLRKESHWVFLSLLPMELRWINLLFLLFNINSAFLTGI